jgi:SecD/SecF fusion protein
LQSKYFEAVGAANSGLFRARRSASLARTRTALIVLCAVLALCGCSPQPPKHGTAFMLEFGTNTLELSATQPPSLTRAQQVVRERLKGLGVRSSVEPAGSNRILIKVPPIHSNSLAEVRRVLSKAGRLEFRMVHPESDKLIAQNLIEPGYEVLRIQQRSGRADPSLVYLVKKKTERGLTGSHIHQAHVTRHHLTNEPEIQFEFDKEGAKLFAEITREYMPSGNTYHQLAIVLDGQLHSAPRINEPIEGGRGMITGNFEIKEASALATVLQNPLDLPPRIVEETNF